MRTLLARAGTQPSTKPSAERIGPRFVVDPAARKALLKCVRASSTARRLAIRAVVVLLADAGWSNARIATEMGITRRTVALWKTRYRTGGLAAIVADAPGRGRKPGRNAGAVARILAATHERPPVGRRWTVRTLARAVGVSHATVQRVWREHGLTPALRTEPTASSPA
jgi:transposase